MPPSSPQRIFGHSLPDDLVVAVARNTHVPLLSEGWFVAGVVSGVSIAVVTFVFFGSVFFSDMPRSNPAAVGTVLWISLFLGLVGGLAGLVVLRRFRRGQQQNPRGPSPDLHRAVALHRRFSAALLLLLGLSGLWHAWFFSPLTRALGVLAFIMALGLGFVALPGALALITGHSRRSARAARALDRILMLAIGLTGVLITLPPVARSEPGAFFLVLAQVLGLIALPWVAPMLAAARIHSRHAQLKPGTGNESGAP